MRRREPALRVAADRLSASYGVKANMFAIDLAAQGNGSRLAEAVAAQGLTVDILVNNASYGQAGAFAARTSASSLA